MAGRDGWWLLLPRQLRELPADLAAVVALVLLTDIVVLAPVDRETPLRIVRGLPLVLFLPGKFHTDEAHVQRVVVTVRHITEFDYPEAFLMMDLGSLTAYWLFRIHSMGLVIQPAKTG